MVQVAAFEPGKTDTLRDKDDKLEVKILERTGDSYRILVTRQ